MNGLWNWRIFAPVWHHYHSAQMCPSQMAAHEQFGLGIDIFYCWLYFTHHLIQACFWCKVITHHCHNTTSFSPWFTNKAVNLPAPYLPVPTMNSTTGAELPPIFFYRYSCLINLLRRIKYIHLSFLFTITDTQFTVRIFASNFDVAGTDVYMLIYYFSWVHSLIPPAWRIILCQPIILFLLHVWNIQWEAH